MAQRIRRKHSSLSDLINNTRGMGLARDVKAGQAPERPRSYIRADKRKQGTRRGR